MNGIELCQLFKTTEDKAAAVALVAPTLTVKLADKKEGQKALDVANKLTGETNMMLALFMGVLKLTADAKTSSQATNVCKDAISKAKGKKSVAAFLPLIMGAIDNPPQAKWKIKVAALHCLNENLLMYLNEHCPKQLEHEMASIVKTCVACCKEIRAEIKDLGTKLLQKIGKLVKCYEIANISQKIIDCLCNFGNSALATETLYLIANTTFLSRVDAASFALLFPIIERAMKETPTEGRKNGIMIVGAAVVLIASPDILEPYLGSLVPLLEDLCVEPQFEISREAAKALGQLAKNLPEVAENRIVPWALEKMADNSKSEDVTLSLREGSALGLAEVCNQVPDFLPRVLQDHIVPRIFPEKDSDTSKEAKASAYVFLECMCKVDCFDPYVELVTPWIMAGVAHKEKLVHNSANRCATTLIGEFGGLKADLLVRPVADACFSFTTDASMRDKSAKETALILLRLLVEKVSESRAYGSDMMSMETCTMETRHAFMALLQIMRSDSDANVRRQANKTLQEQLDSVAKARRETRDVLLCAMKDILANTKSDLKRKVTEKALAEAKASEADYKEFPWDQDHYDNVIMAEGSVLIEYPWDGADVKLMNADWLAANYKNATERQSAVLHLATDGKAGAEFEIHWHEIEEYLSTELKKVRSALGYDKVYSVDDFDTIKNYKTELKTFEERAILSIVLDAASVQGAVNVLKREIQISDAQVKTLEDGPLKYIYDHYHVTGVSEDDKADYLCKVDNLMLMYGGGHMLLKDTTFALKRGHRYGVVGRNGTGKTTLMNLLAKKGIPQIPKEMSCIHVKPEVLDVFMESTCFDFLAKDVQRAMERVPTTQEIEESLTKVLFPKDLWKNTIGELSGGWRMRLLIAGAMMKEGDVLLLDEPTNHLDVNAVTWLADYLTSLPDTAIMVISHDPYFLNRVCTDVINYNNGKLVYYTGNFNDFKKSMGLGDGDAAALLAGQIAVTEDGGVQRADQPFKIKDDDESTPATMKHNDSIGSGLAGKGESTPANDSESGDSTPRSEASSTVNTGSGQGSSLDRKAKITFPVPGKVKGVNSLAKPVIEVENLTWAYSKEKGDVIKGLKGKITMQSRVHVRGVNGAGKSTFINLLCGEVHPDASATEQKGTVGRHRNCRLAYMAQQHMHHMKPFMKTNPYIYIQKRFANGYDSAFQERLKEPANEEEAEARKQAGKKHGKYGQLIEDLVGRQVRGKELWYEVKWETLDVKQNTWVNVEGLKQLRCESFALAYDDKQAAVEAGLDQRPLTQREICKHLEKFGITEELALNRNIEMFSAGQKSKVSLAAAFWCLPHVIALDEPTNYIDMETLDALTTALQRFKGGVIIISHSQEFVNKVCTETWHLEGGEMKILKGVGKDAA